MRVPRAALAGGLWLGALAGLWLWLWLSPAGPARRLWAAPRPPPTLTAGLPRQALLRQSPGASAAHRHPAPPAGLSMGALASPSGPGAPRHVEPPHRLWPPLLVLVHLAVVSAIVACLVPLRRAPRGGPSPDFSILTMAVTPRRTGRRRTRVLVLGRCPATVTEPDIRRLFPDTEVEISRRGGALGARCLVRFRTAKEAEAAAKRPVEVNGHPVVMRLEALTKEQFHAAEQKRSVVLAGCPVTMQKADLRKQFPNVELIRLLGQPFSGKCFLVFPAVEDAEALLAQPDLRVNGHPVTAQPAGADTWAYEGQQAALTVYMTGCPQSITALDLQQQFPDVQAVRLIPKWPNGPFSGRCFLVFPTPEAAEEVAFAPELEVAGQPVRAGLAKADQEAFLKDEQARQVVLLGCPLSIQPWDLHQIFPDVEAIRMMPKGGPFNGKCFLVFRTRQEAEAVARDGQVEIWGKVVTARMSESDNATYRQDETARSVVLSGCPEDTTAEELQRIFPRMEAVRLMPKWEGGPFSGMCFLVFPSRAEAAAVVATRQVMVKGTPVTPEFSDEGRAERLQEANARTICVSACPYAATVDDLRRLFPEADAVRRTKNGRFFLCFPTVEMAQGQARRAGLQIDGKVLQINMAAVDTADLERRTVLLTGQRPLPTVAELRQRFPAAQEVRVAKLARDAPIGRAFLIFGSAADAARYAAMGFVTVKGEPMRVKLGTAKKPRQPAARHGEGRASRTQSRSGAHTTQL